MKPSGGAIGNGWAILALLFLANTLNFFDRAVPAIIVEPVRLEFHLSDFQLGLVAAAFTVVYAIAGLPLGRLADRGSRKLIMTGGLAAWSVFTGLNGLAWSFASLLGLRMAVGVGEASYGPAAMSLISDLFAPRRRSRAVGIYMLGLPVGLLAAFFSVGAIVHHYGTWRAAFVVAALPGLVVAAGLLLIREPARGAAEVTAPVDRAFRRILAIPTLRWIILAGIASNFASYATNGFLVPLLQRYYGLGLQQAAMGAGLIVGVTGLVGLPAGGWLADALQRRSAAGRLRFGALSMVVAGVLTGWALTRGAGQAEAGGFIAIFAVGWLMQYQFYTCAYPAIQDVVPPRLQAQAFAVYFGCLYLLGGAFGPVVVGLLSDHYAHAAMAAAGGSVLAPFKAAGLHDALFLVPVSLLLTGVGLWVASRSFGRDAGREGV